MAAAWWLIAALLAAQLQPKRPTTGPRLDPDLEEEETLDATYTFNPIQAQKEIQVGDFYAKKGSWRAAAGRYERATKWQPDLAEAYYKLGVAREKLKRWQDASEAYKKYLEQPGSEKKAGEVKKKIRELEGKKPKADAPAHSP